MSAPQRRIDVAVAVVFNSAGQVLWACRPQGKPYAGYWEFPGGKVEPGETVWQALVRELNEELGITAQEGGPWFVVEHDYEHAQVRLHFYRVWRFEGAPAALEGQGLKWAGLNGHDLSPILPATEPLLPALAQPQTMWITQYGGAEAGFAARLEQRLNGAEPRSVYVQFREKQLQGSALLAAFAHCRELCLSRGQILLINSDAYLALQSHGVAARDTEGAALHLTEHHLLHGPPVGHGMPVLGASVHGAAGLAAAFAQGLRYALLGAVQATASHPGQPGMGWLAFREQVEQARLPVFAVGGMRPQDRLLAMRNGAHGLAMIRGQLIDCTSES